MNTPNKQILIKILNETRVRNSRTPSTDLYSHQSGAATRNGNNRIDRNENGESSSSQDSDIIKTRGSGGPRDYSNETSSNSKIESTPGSSTSDSSTSRSMNPIGGDSYTTKLGTVMLAKGAYDTARASKLGSKVASKASKLGTNIASGIAAINPQSSIANRAGQATRIAATNTLSAAKDIATNAGTAAGTAARTAISNPATIKTTAKTAASVAGNVAKGVAKNSLKAVPIAGAIATAGQAYDDLRKGKWGKALARLGVGAASLGVQTLGNLVAPGAAVVAGTGLNIAGNVAIDALWEHQDTGYYQNKLIEKLNDKHYSKYMLSE